MFAFSCSAEKSHYNDRVTWRAAPYSVSDSPLSPVYSAFSPELSMQPCSEPLREMDWILKSGELLLFVFEARKSDWTFRLDEKIGKNFREEQRDSRLSERAAAGLRLPQMSMPHERSALLAEIPSSFSNRLILSSEFRKKKFYLDFYSILKSPNEWLNCLILALYIQDTKNERNSLFWLTTNLIFLGPKALICSKHCCIYNS